MPFLKIKSKNLFNLDSTPITIDIEDNDIKGRWKSMKIIVGSAIGCITALVILLVIFTLVILYLRRRNIRLKEQKEQKVNDEAVTLR